MGEKRERKSHNTCVKFSFWINSNPINVGLITPENGNLERPKDGAIFNSFDI